MQTALPPLQQFCDAPFPPHTSPSGTQFCARAQRRTPSASGVPHEPEQHWRSSTHTSFNATQPHMGKQYELPKPSGVQSVSQHERSPLHGSLVGTHWVSRSHLCVVGSHPPSQQSALVSQMSPPARQKLKKEQRPPMHVPEQQLPPELQTSPRVEQLPPSEVHVPLHSLLQHSVFDVQAVPAGRHTVAVEHVLVPGSQKREQHSLDSAHVAPTDLHSFGPLHRMTPSASLSQRLSQHWLFAVHVSPVSRHEDAGTSHLLLTQLSEQQSVFMVHALAYARHVVQFTPAKHVLPPKQQPFAHDVALQTHVPLTH
jgi:hypothetical protein